MKKLALAGLMAFATSTAAFAEGKTHNIAVHVDQADAKVMNIALNNIKNLTAYYKSQGDEVVVELVAYGPGLTMYLENSPVSARIASMSMEMDHITFAACGNTIKGMSKKLGKDVTLLSEAVVVPSGVVRLVELQEAGYSYVKP